MNKSPNNDLNVVVRPTSLHLERGTTQGAAYGAQASSDPPRTEASPRSRQESVPRPLRTTQDPLLSEAATIKIVCAIGQLNATQSTRQIQGTANRIPLCESFLGLARANAGYRWGPQKRRTERQSGQVSRVRRGSNETKLVLVGVGSGKTGNLWSPSIPHAEAGSFVSWALLEPYAVRGRRVKRGGKGGGSEKR